MAEFEEFVTVGFCGERVYVLGELAGYCTKAPDHKGGCTHVMTDPRENPLGHFIHYIRDRALTTTRNTLEV